MHRRLHITHSRNYHISLLVNIHKPRATFTLLNLLLFFYVKVARPP